MLEKIFRDLGKRLSKENDLSDLTWVMLQHSEIFKKTFMELFDFKKYDTNKPLSFYREVSSSDGKLRPDFVIYNDNNSFIVENKIYDINYHFPDYAGLSEGKSGLGIIINHEMDTKSKQDAKQYEFKVKKWKDFKKLLTKKIKKSANSEEIKYIKAYIEFLKEVCSMVEIKEIRFYELRSLFNLSNMIKEIINEIHRTGFEVKYYPTEKTARAFGEDWSGHYFTINRSGSKKFLYPFFGIYYETEPPFICFAFERDWCHEFYKKYNGKRKTKKMYTVYTSGEEIIFELTPKYFQEFKDASIIRQKEILIEFFNDMVGEVQHHLR